MQFKSKIFARIASCVICLITLMSVCVMTVSAVTYKLNVSDQALWEASEDLQAAATELGLQNSGGVLTFEPENFINETDKKQKQLVKNFMTAVIDADLSAEGTTSIMDALNSDERIDMSIYLIPYMFDEMRGDVIGGAQFISPLLPVINIVIGIGALIILALLIVHTVYDLLIIVVPFLRSKVIDKSNSSGSTKDGGRPAFVSEAAWSAIKEAEASISGNDGSYKSALWTYFKRRLPEYVVMVIVIAFLVLGGFGNLVQALLSLGQNYTG